MSLPKDFESVIKEEFGDFGWDLANSFSFIAEFLGYKVYDISAVENALKNIAADMGSSLTNYRCPNDFPKFFKKYYPRIHKGFIRRAKNIKNLHEDIEDERKEVVVDRFAEYAITKNPEVFNSIISTFFKDYVMFTLSLDMDEWLLDIEKEIDKQANIDF